VAAQEVAAQAMAVGTVGVVGVAAPHRAGLRTTPTTSAEIAARWGIGHASAA
jgi:hypothetical protein